MKRIVKFTIAALVLLNTRSNAQEADSCCAIIKHPSNKKRAEESKLVFADSSRIIKDFLSFKGVDSFIRSQKDCDCGYISSLTLRYLNGIFQVASFDAKNEFERLSLSFVEENFKKYSLLKKPKFEKVKKWGNVIYLYFDMNFETNELLVTLKERKGGYSIFFGKYKTPIGAGLHSGARFGSVHLPHYAKPKSRQLFLNHLNK